jgi:PAS domain S-box-containing protein
MPPLEAFAIPAAVFDGTGVLLSCNSAFETLTGYAALEGMRLEVLHIQHPDGTLEDLFEVAQTLDLPATGHASLTRADTVVLEVAWTLGLWPAPGEGPDFLVLTATDVTDEKCLACKIKHSRDKYREAFDEQTELVCRFDPDTTIRFVNDAYARAFGRSPRQLIGSRLVDLLSPQDGEDFIAYLATFSRSDNIRDGEESFELAAGIQSHQWWRRRAIYDPQGQLVAFQSVGRDITRLKQRQAEEARISRIVEASPVIGMRLRYAPGWPIEYVTANVESMTGWPPEALTGSALPSPQIVHPDDRDGLTQCLRDLVKAASDQGSAVSPKPHPFRLLTRSGAVRWVETSITAEKNRHGQVSHLEALLSDVSAHVEARAKIEASERRLLDFAEAANDWFWEMGPDLRFCWISRRATENHTFDLSHVIGKTREEIALVEDPALWQAHQANLDARLPFRDFRFRVPLTNGKTRRVSVSGRPFFNADGQFAGYRGTSTDVTNEERTQAALAATYQSYRSIFHASQVGLWDLDLSPMAERQNLSAVVINGVNQAALEQLGWDAEQPLTGQTLGAHPALQMLFKPLFADRQAFTGDQVRCDIPWPSPNGTRHLLMLFRPPQNADGSFATSPPSSAVVSVLDITDRVVVEEQLRDSEGRFRNMFDHSVPGMALIGLDGRWLRVNPALCRMFSSTETTLFALTLFDLLPERDHPDLQRWMDEAIAGGGKVRTAEQRLVRPNGQSLWIHYSMVLLRDRAGNPLYFIGQAVDISERKEAETRAAEAEAQLRQAIAAMDDGFVLFDKDDQLVIWNDRFAGLYDSVADHLAVGLSYQQLSQAVIDRRHYAGPPPSLPSLLARRARLRADQSTLLREQRLADGRWLEIKETSTPDGEIVGICVDITAQKARETALRQAMEDTRLADRAKSEFLANMSHELRTPLNAIIGFSEILWQELFGPLGNPLYQEYAEGIHESGRHLLQIIGDILDLSKIEAGELSLDIESLDLSTIIDSALRMIRARAQSRKIGLELALAPAMPRILGDELRVKQILINILSNAIKFTEPERSIRLWWESTATTPLTLVIEDQGIGMSAEEITIACAMFGQVQSAFSRKIQGTGLGLPICIKLMEAHGGSLSISSEKGVGTQVRLHFQRLALEAT